MSYQEKKTVVNIFFGAGFTAAYCTYAYGRYRSGVADLNDLAFWGVTMLTFIGIGVAAMIVVQIAFHIALSIGIAVKTAIETRNYEGKDLEKSFEGTFIEDEMDKLIELKSMRLGFCIAGVGFIAGLVLLVLGYPAAVMLNVQFLAFSIGSLSEGFLILYYYRKGVRNG